MRKRIHGTFLLLFALAFASPASHSHDEFDTGWTPAERQAAVHHTLTMDRIRKLITISREFTELVTRQPLVCNWMNQITGPETLSRQVRAFEANATIREIIEHAAMTIEDYLLTLHTVSQTALRVHETNHGIRSAAWASAANIQFYRANQTQIERLLDEPDPC